MGVQTPIKGQEVELLLLSGTDIEDSFTAITDFSLNFDIELIEENYLGMTSAEFDEVFKGVRGDVSMQLRSKKAIQFVYKIIDKAKRRTPGQIFSFKAKMAFPNGEFVRLHLPDIHFGAVPFNFANRTQHASMKVDFACSGATLIG